MNTESSVPMRDDKLAPLAEEETLEEQEEQNLQKMNEPLYKDPSTILLNFQKLVGELKAIVVVIEQYEASTNEADLANIGNTQGELALDRKYAEETRRLIHEKLQRVYKVIHGHNAHKKNLEYNHSVLIAMECIKELRNGESGWIKGHATLDDDFTNLHLRRRTNGEAIAVSLEKRRGILEKIRDAEVRTCMGARLWFPRFLIVVLTARRSANSLDRRASTCRIMKLKSNWKGPRRLWKTWESVMTVWIEL
jgi:hypothetical protein